MENRDFILDEIKKYPDAAWNYSQLIFNLEDKLSERLPKKQKKAAWSRFLSLCEDMMSDMPIPFFYIKKCEIDVPPKDYEPAVAHDIRIPQGITSKTLLLP